MPSTFRRTRRALRTTAGATASTSRRSFGDWPGADRRGREPRQTTTSGPAAV